MKKQELIDRLVARYDCELMALSEDERVGEKPLGPNHGITDIATIAGYFSGANSGAFAYDIESFYAHLLELVVDEQIDGMMESMAIMSQGWST